MIEPDQATRIHSNARARRRGPWQRIVLLLLAMNLVGSSLAPALTPEAQDIHERRHFDGRIAHNATFTTHPGIAQRLAFQGLAAGESDLAASYDRATGATRTLYRRTGYLTDTPATESSALDLALGFLSQNTALLGLEPADIASYEVTDHVFTRATGTTRIYLRQTFGGLPVYNGQLQVNINREGRILSVNNHFVPRLGQSVASGLPSLPAAQAVSQAASHLDLATVDIVQVQGPTDTARNTTLRAPTLSQDDIQAELMWLPIRRGDVRLVWRFQLRTPDNNHWYDMTVDAHSGKVWTRFDWVASGVSHRVVAAPAESPYHLPNPPPADGRLVEGNPANATASPNGWHDDGTTQFTITRGNNVNAYEDSDGTNSPSTPQPDCGMSLSCEFDFPIDFSTQEPDTYQDAAVSNLFYWNNVIHDVQWFYGFDEASGNFQATNFGPDGLGGDDVQAEAQDIGNCNANFAVPPDGMPPRMQVFTCDNVSPARDGSFDNGFLIHEYGHGISNRTVGGPSNSSCLGNLQQPGEGLSDWWALAYTAEVGDAGTDKRGFGNYLFGQPVDGDGIRPQPYSTNPLINSYTYESINGLQVPEGLGSVWAQAAWEVYWALVDEHGFDPDLYNAQGGSGNQRAMLYVQAGLQNSICSPAFTDVRDGMIQAAVDNFGGEDVCLLWETFGAFGLGTDAVSGGPNSTAPTNGFDTPAECQCEQGQTVPIADAGPDQVSCFGEPLMLGTPALPGHTYLWSPGGETTAQITVSPAITTQYTVTVTTDCGTEEDSATVFTDDGQGGLHDDMEAGGGNWTTSGLWHLVTNTSCTAPEDGFSSPVSAFYYGQDATCTYNTGATTQGDLISRHILGVNGSSILEFDYFRQVEFFNDTLDVTQVDVLTEDTATTVFYLDSSTASTSTWTAVEDIDLSAFAGQPIQLRFRFNSGDGAGNNFVGWLVDDVVVTGTSQCTNVPGALFFDSFESGDISAWSNAFP